MLRVSDDASHLCDAAGQPWFYLADTAWQLFQSLTIEEAHDYFAVRSSQGFTAIQAVAYPEFGGIESPNRYGHLAMWETDPARPNAAYFDHISNVIDVARQFDLVVALLPTWGCHVTRAWATNLTVQFTTTSASEYGRFVVERLGGHDNLIWVIGGDRDVRDAKTRQIWDALAYSIRLHDPQDHLMTFHPSGGTSSSNWVADADWIDFHMLQSGHTRRDSRNWDLVRRDCELEPRKPVIDGEPCYENHPVCFEPSNGWFDEYDVRKASWRAVLSGACGHTYGCHDVWMMADEKRRPVATSRGNWKTSQDLPGAGQMQHLRAIAESKLLPGHFNSDVSIATNTEDSDHISVARNGTPGEFDATYLMAYFPIKIPHVLIDLSVMSCQHYRSWWLNPRNGIALPGDAGLVSTRYTPAFPEGGPDWVLVIEQIGG